MTRLGLLLLVATCLLAACGTQPADPAGTIAGGPLTVVAAENTWGSLAAQVGTSHVTVTSILTNPNADPHDYEPSPAVARTFATSRYVIVNGAGYDAWAEKLVQANPVRGQVVLNVATLLNKSAGANPHFWYDPAAVASVVQRIASDLANIDSANAAAYIAAGNQLQTSGFAKFTQLVSSMQQRYAGVPVGATESIAVYLTGALHLSLITPPAFMQAIAEGHEPAAADTALFHQQLSRKEMRVLLFNTQGATPATTALKQAAQQAGISVVDITETLSPPDATFQDWQVAQLTALDSALHQATGQ